MRERERGGRSEIVREGERWREREEERKIVREGEREGERGEREISIKGSFICTIPQTG